MGRELKRGGFTLMELLMVLLIITILAGLLLTALQGAAEEARADRTKAIVMKIDQLIMERYNGYTTRTLPIKIPAGTAPRVAAGYRLFALRDLMRMELPDRKSDVIDPPADIDPLLPAGANLHRYYMTPAALQRTYQRKVNVATGFTPANWTEVSQGAECLYLIVSAMHDGDKNALDFFMPNEIGDYDGDGMLEIWDAWGRPIEFLRWAPAYTEEAGMLTMQSRADGPLPGSIPFMPDGFDPVKVDYRWTDTDPDNNPFALHPLIFSGGKDKSLDLFTDNSPSPFHRYANPATPDNNWPDPYGPFADGVAGTAFDSDGDGDVEATDNITNHWVDPSQM